MSKDEPAIVEPNYNFNERTEKYDYVIVGAGVAGVLSAEMLSRSGKRVLLIEKQKMIGSESSSEQHGWGQFGYLYLSAEDPGVAQSCLQNIDILLNSYPMPGNNLIADESGQLISTNPESDGSWYREDPVYYYYPEPDESELELSESEKKHWEKRLHNVLQRTEAISEVKWTQETKLNLMDLPEYSEEQGRKLLIAKKAARKWMQKTAKNNTKGRIAVRLEKEKIGINVATNLVIESHDRPMRSTCILESIYNRFKRNGGDTCFTTEVIDYKDEGVVKLITSNEEEIRADKVIFTAGGGLHNVQGSNVQTVMSPLLIVSPPVCERNIVYLTPRTELTINHMHHVDTITGKAYSIIGNGDSIKPGDEVGLKSSRDNIIAQASRVFPSINSIPEQDIEVYFGHKTEFISPGAEINYHFAFNPIDSEKKIWAAVPGKFTLAPSLATNIYEKLEGTSPPIVPFTLEEQAVYQELLKSSPAIAQTLHSQVVGKRLGSDLYPERSRIERSQLRNLGFFSEEEFVKEGASASEIGMFPQSLNSKNK